MCSMPTHSVGEYFHTESIFHVKFLLGPRHVFDNLGHFYLREFRSLSYLKIPISGFRDGRLHNIVMKIINKIRSLYHLTPELY